MSLMGCTWSSFRKVVTSRIVGGRLRSRMFGPRAHIRPARLHPACGDGGPVNVVTLNLALDKAHPAPSGTG
ncbi:hypothetical protein GCM10009838_57860 [Catenulispora subtropica]|uniref:Uncharacterized protein n=1 Tax=Catenulispora subtropica TaxID=450798 RepID=A0ABN2SIX6_9ACTN